MVPITVLILEIKLLIIVLIRIIGVADRHLLVILLLAMAEGIALVVRCKRTVNNFEESFFFNDMSTPLTRNVVSR